MALTTVEIPPLDPYGFTGPVRVMSGIARTGTVVADTAYGEFARWLYIGVSGNVSYVKWDGQTETLSNISAGIWHPIYSIMINSSGTTATGLKWGS